MNSSPEASIGGNATRTWLGELGHAVGQGPYLAPGEPAAKRDSFGAVVLVERFREAIRALKPAFSEEASLPVFENGS